MTTALTFNGITLSPISHQNNLWIRAVELAHALGYAQENSVSRIYRSNSDEFTPDMTQVIEIFDGADSALSTKARIFSLRGCHLVAMFARTPVAKAFRRWVLDVLDKLDAEQHAALTSCTEDFPGSVSITPSTTEDRKPLRALVGTWAQVSGLPFAACWNQLKAAFNLANIKELPQEWIPDAIDWVQKRIDALPAPAPATALPSSPASPDDVEGHLAAIRDHIRHIHRHEEALFLLARKALPAVRKPGDMFSPARRTGLTAFQSMEDCAGALDYSLRALESAARTMLAMR